MYLVQRRIVVLYFFWLLDGSNGILNEITHSFYCNLFWFSLVCATLFIDCLFSNWWFWFLLYLFFLLLFFFLLLLLHLTFYFRFIYFYGCFHHVYYYVILFGESVQDLIVWFFQASYLCYFEVWIFVSMTS